MMTINTKEHCPRCRGNLGREKDFETGWDAVCLQCGYRRPIVEMESSGRGAGKARSRRLKAA